MSAAIEISGLRKDHRRKTTTIRCLLGLVRPTSGSLHLLGRPMPSALPTALAGVGAIVEAPAFLPTMTGRERRSSRRATAAMIWTPVQVEGLSRTAPWALFQMVLYVVVIGALATAAFARRDVTAAA